MFEDLFTNKTTTKKKVDFSNLFADKKPEQAKPEPRIFKLDKSLGGGEFYVSGRVDRDVSQSLKNEIRGGSFQETSEEVDHIFPLALGGTNEPNNLEGKKSPLSFMQKIGNLFGKEYSVGERPSEERQAGKTKQELQIINDYEAGKIGIWEAREKIAKVQREVTGLDEKDPEKITLKDLSRGAFDSVFGGLAEWGKKLLTKSAEKTREEQKKAIDSIDVKAKRGKLYDYFGKEKKLISPATGISTIKREYTPDDIIRMSDKKIESLYRSVYLGEAEAMQDAMTEFVGAALPTVAKLPGEIIKIGNINKIKQGVRETPEVIDLRGTEMIEPKKVGKITEQGFEPVKLEQIIANTVEAQKKELNLDAFKNSFKKQEPIMQEISKAKAEGKSFEEFVRGQSIKDGVATRFGEVSKDGAYFSKQVDGFENKNYFNAKTGDIKNAQYDISKAKVVKSDTEEALTVLKEALKDVSNTQQDIIRLKREITSANENGGKAIIDWRLNDEIPSIVKSAKKLGYDGINVIETGDVSKPTSLFIWNTNKIKELQTKSQLKQLWDTTEIKAPKVEKPIIKALEPKKSITAQKLNKIMPDEYKLNESYDAITLKNELNRASKEISTNSEEALRKAFDVNERVDRRIAKLEEFSQIAKRDKDYDAVNRLFTQANKIGTETAQGLNMMKALHSVNPEYKYMQDVVGARLKKVKVGVGDIKKAKENAKALIVNKAKDLKARTKNIIKVKDAQKLLDKLIC